MVFKLRDFNNTKVMNKININELLLICFLLKKREKIDLNSLYLSSITYYLLYYFHSLYLLIYCNHMTNFNLIYSIVIIFYHNICTTF